MEIVAQEAAKAFYCGQPWDPDGLLQWADPDCYKRAADFISGMSGRGYHLTPIPAAGKMVESWKEQRLKFWGGGVRRTRLSRQ